MHESDSCGSCCGKNQCTTEINEDRKNGRTRYELVCPTIFCVSYSYNTSFTVLHIFSPAELHRKIPADNIVHPARHHTVIFHHPVLPRFPAVPQAKRFLVFSDTQRLSHSHDNTHSNVSLNLVRPNFHAPS